MTILYRFAVCRFRNVLICGTCLSEICNYIQYHKNFKKNKCVNNLYKFFFFVKELEKHEKEITKRGSGKWIKKSIEACRQLKYLTKKECQLYVISQFVDFLVY